MTILSADKFPGAEHKPLTYPGDRPHFSYVYYQGKVHKITPRGKTYANLLVDDSPSKIKLNNFLAARDNALMDERHAVLAVGSNGCPGRLAEKYAHQPDVAIPVFIGTLSNTVIVYSRQLTPYGVLPATYLYQPDAVSWLSVTMLTKEQKARMDETEAVGDFYQRIAVPGYFCIKDGPMIHGLTAYIDHKILTYRGKPIYLKMFVQEGPDWPKMDESELMSLLFSEARLLKDKTIEERHRQLLTDETLRTQLMKFLDARMSALAVDEQGELVEKARPNITCSRVIRTDTRPSSEGTYIVRLSKANGKRLKVRNGNYLRIRHGNMSAMTCLSVDDELDNDTIRMDQTLRMALGLASMLQGPKTELIYSPDGCKDLRYPIVIRRERFGGPSWLTKSLRQQYLICVVHHAMVADMETPLVRLAPRVMQVLGIEPGDRVRIINGKRYKTLRCLPFDPGYQPPSKTMKKGFANWMYELPKAEDLHLPWITVDLQTRLALNVKPWQSIMVGRDTYHALKSEFSQVALAVALAALGGAIIVEDTLSQLTILLIGFLIVSILIWLKIRSKV